jgi:iron complex outermembrane receptor protein
LPLIPANNWSNTIRTEFKIRNWFEAGYATLNFTSTFNQNNVSGFETQTNGYTLVNLGLGGTVKLGKTVFDVNQMEIIYLIKDISHTYPFKK